MEAIWFFGKIGLYALPVTSVVIYVILEKNINKGKTSWLLLLLSVGLGFISGPLIGYLLLMSACLTGDCL